MNDSFWVMVNTLPLDVVAPFETTEGDNDYVYQTLFGDHCEGEGVFINA